MRIRSLMAGITMGLGLLGGQAAAQDAAGLDGSIAIELNRLADAQEGGCSVYMAITNETSVSLTAFEPDVFIFDTDGIILQRFRLVSPPVPDGSQRVLLFTMADQTCDGIGRILLNGVFLCETSDGPRDDCLDAVAVSSRAEAPLDF